MSQDVNYDEILQFAERLVNDEKAYLKQYEAHDSQQILCYSLDLMSSEGNKDNIKIYPREAVNTEVQEQIDDLVIKLQESFPPSMLTIRREIRNNLILLNAMKLNDQQYDHKDDKYKYVYNLYHKQILDVYTHYISLLYALEFADGIKKKN